MVQLIHRRVWFNRQTPSEVIGPDLDLSGSFTLCCRFKTSGFKDDYQTLINKEDAGLAANENYHMRINAVTNVLFGRFGTGVGVVDVTGTTIVTDGAWYYGVFVHDAAAQTLTLYVNAVRDAVPTATGGAVPFTNAALLRVGRWPGTSLQFTGYISEVSIYDRALSASEVNSNYLHPNNPIRRGLQLSWTQDSIDRPAAGTWQDRSGNARNGTITNATTSKYPAISAGRNALFFPTAAGTDRVDCGNGASLQLTGTYSAEIWVKLPPMIPPGTDNAFIGKWGGGATGWYMGYRRTTGLYYLYQNGAYVINSVLMPNAYTSTWAHIVVTNTPGAASGEIYINGINKTNTRANTILTDSGANLLVGNTSGLIYSTLGGYIAAARVYNRILTPEEVLYNMQHPNNPIKRGRVLDLSPESLYGIRWYDLSGNANHGTITGAVAKNIGLLTGR